MPAAAYALSVKQPWAALLIHGLKTVEVRTWPTRRRGPVLIHAGKIPDPRPEAWACLVGDPVLIAAAGIVVGVVGMAELVGCEIYDTPAGFAADAARHRNAAAWFRPPRLYGFVFAGAAPVPFRAVPGNTGFFRVPG